MANDKKNKAPQYMDSPLHNPMLNYGVYYMSTVEKILYSAVVIVAGGLVGLVFYGGLFKVDGEATAATYISNGIVFAGIGLLAAKFFVPAIVQMLLDRRKKTLEKQFMDLLEALTSSLAAGNTMHGAIVNARTDLLNQYSENSLIIVELSEIVSGIDNGKNLEEMLQNFGIRSDNDDIMNFANVISNCYRLGGNFGDVVRHTREIISDKVIVADEIKTKIASNKLQHNVMCLMPIAIVAMLKFSSGEFADNLASFIGVLATTVALGIFVGSYFWGQKIIDIG